MTILLYVFQYVNAKVVFTIGHVVETSAYILIQPSEKCKVKGKFSFFEYVNHCELTDLKGLKSNT